MVGGNRRSLVWKIIIIIIMFIIFLINDFNLTIYCNNILTSNLSKSQPNCFWIITKAKRKEKIWGDWQDVGVTWLQGQEGRIQSEFQFHPQKAEIKLQGHSVLRSRNSKIWVNLIILWKLMENDDKLNCFLWQLSREDVKCYS